MGVDIRVYCNYCGSEEHGSPNRPTVDCIKFLKKKIEKLESDFADTEMSKRKQDIWEGKRPSYSK